MRYSHKIQQHNRGLTNVSLGTVIAISACLILLLAAGTEFDIVTFLKLSLLSFVKIFVAYILSGTSAIIAVLIVDIFPRLEQFFENLFEVLQSLPSIALLPLLIVAFGKTDIVTIIVVGLAMVWPILFSLLTARKQLNSELKEVALIYGARGWKYYWYIFFPMSLPHWISGSIVAWGEAWETVIATELVIAVAGIGGFFHDTNGEPQLFAMLACFMALLYLLSRFIWTPLLKYSSNFSS